MLDLLEYVAGAVVLGVYLLFAVVLPTAVMIGFVLLIGTLVRTVIDPIVERIPERYRSNAALAGIGRPIRWIIVRGTGIVAFLSLVGVASSGPSPGVLAAGFEQIIVTLTAIQDIVATWISGSVLNDMLLQVAAAPGDPPITSLHIFETVVATHIFTALKPGVTILAFRWTFAAFASAAVAVYLVVEPLRALRRRIASIIAPQRLETTLTDEALERQAEMIAQALAKATPAAQPVAVAPAAPVVRWGRPGLARPPATTLAPAPAPGAIASQRVAVVTWDGELAAQLERQLDAAGFAPVQVRSVAEAFASRVWPAIVFIDARHLQWLAPDRLPLLVRARLVAITSDDIQVPKGWQLDTHHVEAGAESLLDLLRKRDARRRTSASRETGA